MKQTLRITHIAAVAASLSSLSAQNGPIGFCNYYDGINGITGGMAGPTVHVTTRADLANYLKSNDPYTIILDADLTGKGLDRTKDYLEVGSNTTLIGGGEGATLNGIGLNIQSKENIIIRNLTIHHADPDAIAGRDTHHVWVDHCDIYSTDEATKEDWDGLIDFTIGSSYITVSYCYLHDHHKCCLLSSGTQHFEDYGKNRTTYHHNAFRLTDQRNPRIGYGLGHVFNNYYEQIGSYCIGGFTQARIVAERNYFSASAKNPFSQMYAQEGPDDYSFAFFENRDNYLAKPCSEITYDKLDFEPADWYDYGFALDAAQDVKEIYPTQVGPQPGLDHEVILWPGNGAKDQPILLSPQWSKLDGETESWFTIGLTEETLERRSIDAEHPLAPATTYLWRVYTATESGTVVSPIYRFTTADTKPATPYPADGETNAKLREALTETSMAGPMTLRWQPACDVDHYEVSLWDEAGHTLVDHQSVESNAFNPGSLRYGERYTWQVNTVRALQNELVEGERWSFTTPRREIREGRTELEHLCRSGIAYIQPMNASIWYAASNDSITIGDRGPGALSGVFSGTSGIYSLSVTYLDGSKGKDWYGVSVNDTLVEEWKSGSTSGQVAHKVTPHVHLTEGDQLRIDFYTTSGQRARMDCLDLTLLEADGIESLEPDAPTETIWYDLSGRRVTAPQTGKIYIRTSATSNLRRAEACYSR